MHVLIIEDDEVTAQYISKGLTDAGHTSNLALNGKDGLYLGLKNNYEVLIVDRMLPSMDGLTLISTLRGDGNNTPALVLSALGEVDDRIEGLKAGGDDYLTKPFSLAELLARLEALNRRYTSDSQDTLLVAGDLTMNLLSREVKRAGIVIDLQPREFRLLEYLIRNCNHVITRTMLLENVWDYNFDPQTNVIDVHISRLRGKIDKNFDTQLLNTVRGTGYILRAENS